MILRRMLVVAVAATALVAGAMASLAFGAVDVPLGDVFDALLGGDEDTPLGQIVVQLRLPRTVEALAVGAALGVAGALLQGALGNPLASPDVIGVTGGAGFGALLILLVFPGSIALLPMGALLFVRLGAGVAAALLAAASAAIAGLLGFLGLVIPHVVRLAGGTSSHGYVIPVSALAGAALLVSGDTLARVVRAPIEMPVGPLMVALGVPLFLYLLRRAV